MATGLMALLMIPVITLLEVSGTVWKGYHGDHSRLDQQNAVMRHLVRHLRDAKQILEVRGNRLVCILASGEKVAWEQKTGNIVFHNSKGANILSTNVKSLLFAAFHADAATKATTEADVQLLRCTLVTPLDGTAGNKTIESWVWCQR